MKIWKRLSPYRDVLAYGFFGVCTTAVNFIAYGLLRYGGIPVLVSNGLAWILAVLFAFLTNRKWVFHSASHGLRAWAKELVSFVSCRLTTGALDMTIMYLAVDRMGWSEWLWKVLSNGLVIVLNYVLSKWLVFRKTLP